MSGNECLECRNHITRCDCPPGKGMNKPWITKGEFRALHMNQHTPNQEFKVTINVNPANVQDAIIEVGRLLQMLKRFANSHYGAIARGGYVLGDTPCRYTPGERVQSFPRLHGKMAHAIISDDPPSKVAKVEVKCTCGKCDACLGPALRDAGGEPLRETKRIVPEGGRTLIADQGEAIREGMRKLEAERAAILNRPDPDLAPRIRPKLGEDPADPKVAAIDAADLVFEKTAMGGRFKFAHCLHCSAPDAVTVLCSHCVCLVSTEALERYNARYNAAVKHTTSP